MIEQQSIVNLVLGILFTINGTLISLLYANFSTRLAKLEDKTSFLEILVNGKYMPREEAMLSEQRIMERLDVIRKEINECRLEGHHRRREDSASN